MLFLWYPKCTTCQKAKAFLDERGVSYEARDIKLENPTAEELRGWWEKSGMPLKKFFNTSGLQYKALGLKDKLPEMSEEEQLALLATDGMLVKRPILVGENVFCITGGGSFCRMRLELLDAVGVSYAGAFPEGTELQPLEGM